MSSLKCISCLLGWLHGGDLEQIRMTSDMALQHQECNHKHIKLKFIQPGKPAQNAYIERFNRIFREDILDAYWFEDLESVRIISEKWRQDYNMNHPHSSLGGISPDEYYKRAVNSGKVQPRKPSAGFATINSEEIAIKI